MPTSRPQFNVCETQNHGYNRTLPEMTPHLKQIHLETEVRQKMDRPHFTLPYPMDIRLSYPFLAPKVLHTPEVFGKEQVSYPLAATPVASNSFPPPQCLFQSFAPAGFPRRTYSMNLELE